MTYLLEGATKVVTDNLVLADKGGQVVATVHLPDDAAPGWYELPLQLIDGANNLLYTVETTVGADVDAYIDLAAASGSSLEQTVFRGQTAEFTLDLTIPDGWAEPVSLAVSTGSASPELTGIALSEVGGDATGTELAFSTPGSYQLRVVATTPSDNEGGRYFLPLKLTSGSTERMVDLTIIIGTDFDTDSDNTLSPQTVVAGETATYQVEVEIPTLWTTPIKVMTSEAYQHTDIVSMQVREAGSGEALAEELVLSAPGTYQVEVVVTTSSDATPRQHTMWVGYADSETEKLLSSTTLVLNVE